MRAGPATRAEWRQGAQKACPHEVNAKGVGGPRQIGQVRVESEGAFLGLRSSLVGANGSGWEGRVGGGPLASSRVRFLTDELGKGGKLTNGEVNKSACDELVRSITDPAPLSRRFPRACPSRSGAGVNGPSATALPDILLLLAADGWITGELDGRRWTGGRAKVEARGE